MLMAEENEKPGNCPVCDEPCDLKRDETDPEVWRFMAHSRPYFHKKKLIKGIGCPGEHKTYDEAWVIKHQLDANGKQFPD
jgi:hypothetical protein